jgi:plastocyanin
MKRRLLPVTAAMLAVALIANGAVAAPGAIRTTGDERVVPNAMVQATLRFTPGQIGATSGDEVTWTYDDNSGAPHTATIVEEFPEPNLGAIFACVPCADALAAHNVFGPVVDPGDDGFNEPGDSLLFFPGQSISADLTAAPGTTLKFLCAVHPWMQGEIRVD